MILGLCLILVTALVWTITAVTSRPASGARSRSGSSPRDLDRRAAQLRVCPDRVTSLDLELLLVAGANRYIGSFL